MPPSSPTPKTVPRSLLLTSFLEKGCYTPVLHLELGRVFRVCEGAHHVCTHVPVAAKAKGIVSQAGQRASSLHPSRVRVWHSARGTLERKELCHPEATDFKRRTRPLAVALIWPLSSTENSAMMLSCRKRPSGSFLAIAYQVPANCGRDESRFGVGR